MPPPPPIESALTQPTSFHRNAYGTSDMKYATIDRSHFRRNNQQLQRNLRESGSAPPDGSDFAESKQRSNSVGENEEEFPEYKMNLPKNKMNTICGRTAFPTGARPTVFQLFEGQNANQLRSQLNPCTSPSKLLSNTSPNAPKTAPKPKAPVKHSSQPLMRVPQHLLATKEIPRNIVESEPEAATPGSFEEQLQRKRLAMKSRSVSVDQTTVSSSYL